MTRVLIDFRMQAGGVGRYGNALLRGLSQVPDGLWLEVVKAGHSAMDKAHSAPFTPWGRRLVAKEAKRSGADLIHGLHFELPRSDLPMVVTIQDLIPFDHPDSMPNPLRRAVFRRIVDRSIEEAAQIIVPSGLTAEAVRTRGAAPEKVRVIPIPVDPVFRPASPEERERARERFAKGRRYIAALYHPKPHKNCDILPKLAPLIDADIVLVVLGAPGGGGPLSDEDMRLFYAGAEIFLLPSIIEGFGLPAVEALACGTVVVCGPQVGALPYCDRGVALANVADPRALAEKIIDLLEDPASITRFVEAGRAQAAELSPRRAAKETYRVYMEALEGGAG